jgi:hypothetical protein
MISSYTVPFLLSTVGIGMQGNSIGIACGEKSKTSFLYLYRIHAIFYVSCILHSKMPYGAFLKELLFFNVSGNSIRFDRIILVV